MKEWMINHWNQFYKDNSGESIAETLVSVLIVAMAMTMLAGAIMTTAKVNSTTRDMKTEFKTEGVITEPATIIISHSNGRMDDVVAVYKFTTNDSNEYIYYEVK